MVFISRGLLGRDVPKDKQNQESLFCAPHLAPLVIATIFKIYKRIKNPVCVLRRACVCPCPRRRFVCARLWRSEDNSR